MCDVCDLSNTVLYDLLYHRAFELATTVNKRGVQVKKGSQELVCPDTPAQPKLTLLDQVEILPLVLKKDTECKKVEFVSSLYYRGECQERCVAATALFRHKNWWINFEWKQAWRESRYVRILIISSLHAWQHRHITLMTQDQLSDYFNRSDEVSLSQHPLSTEYFCFVFFKYYNVQLLSCPPLSLQISLTAADLVQYCQDHRRSDPLLTGIAASSNPFKDKKTCVLLWPSWSINRLSCGHIIFEDVTTDFLLWNTSTQSTVNLLQVRFSFRHI